MNKESRSPDRVSAATQYSFHGSSAGQKAFAGRTIEADLAFLLPHLRHGLTLVDLGCGSGHLTVQLARRLKPGAVVGLDLDEGFIEQAKTLASSATAPNVSFMVASVYEVRLPAESFDVALFSGVLAHLSNPERALREAVRLLKPGGLVAASEPEKHGDWIGGKGQQVIREINAMIRDDFVEAGGDPYIGQRLPQLFYDVGLVRVEAAPRFSPALSSVRVIGELFIGRLSEAAFVSRVVARGSHSREGLTHMIGNVRAWMEDPASVIGISECAVLGWKP